MTKWILILLPSFFSFGNAKAQSDLKVMLKQIALIAVHVKELENAIEIAKEGLTTINEIKNGEFNLHNLFFNSLKSVNPAVAKYSRIAVIITDQIGIVNEFKNVIQKLEADKQITPAELLYVKSVYGHTADECTKSLNDLVAVTTNGNLEMTDDERISRIDIISSGMNDKWVFTNEFIKGANQLMTEKENEDKANRMLKTLE